MEDSQIAFGLPIDYPLEELEIITKELATSGCVVPGYVPPAVGALAWQTFRFASQLEGRTTMILPDRNLVSRVARMAREGGVRIRDNPTQTAMKLVAFAQLNNLQFEPSIAYHELASSMGNEAAMEELSWFRSGDNAHAQDWLDLYFARTSTLPAPRPKQVPVADMARTLHRWRINHVAALKIANLELTVLSPLDRLRTLVSWMIDDFMIAGPAAALAAMYFSPRYSRAGIFKKLRSSDEQRALEGVRNAAWDITHLSDFVRRASENQEARFLFASADVALADIASSMFSIATHWEDRGQTATILSRWWSPSEATEIIEMLEVIVRPLSAPNRSRSFGVEVMEEIIKAQQEELRQRRLAMGIG